jgi:hypothetical protein
MEDIRPYRNDENDDKESPIDWELARIESDDELPFDIPRD